MLWDLSRALPAALATAVLPGYFWASFLRPTRGLGERLAYSTALSMALVPVVALVLARVAGSGVTLWVALASVALVFGTGAAASRAKGPAQVGADPVFPAPPLIRDWRVLALIAAGLVLAGATMADRALPGWPLAVAAIVLLAAGALAGLAAPGPPEALEEAPGGGAEKAPAPEADPAAGPASGTLVAPAQARPLLSRAARPAVLRDPALPVALRGPALALVLALTAARSYVGVVLRDWPFLRGRDLYTHVVMTEQMMAHGSYSSYLVYPPGFSTLSAVVSRLSGLPPMAVFTVLAPALLVVIALGSYALATRLWGWEYGVAAAALSGLVLSGAYAGLAGGRYPDLLDAYFLVPMAVAALIAFYQSASARSGALLAAVGGAVVLYHSVASLYLALLLALVSVAALGHLWLRGLRRQARALALALAAVAGVSAVYALHTYGLPKFLGGGSATAMAVSAALGSQPPLPAVHLLAELAPPLVWLGALGVAMLAADARRLRTPAQLLTVITLLLWCAMMYLGSRTAADGFPQRFERDIGAVLSVIGALALGVILLSLRGWRSERPATVALSCVAAGAAALMVGAQTANNLASADSRGDGLLTRPVAAAGAWLARHNTGGTIISTPYLNAGVSNRAVLAMGGYTGLQSFPARRIAHPRSLPTAGKQPLIDSRTVLTEPGSCQAAAAIARDDVRYVVLYKPGNAAMVARFQSDPSRYRLAFQNADVMIYVPARTVCGA